MNGLLIRLLIGTNFLLAAGIAYLIFYTHSINDLPSIRSEPKALNAGKFPDLLPAVHGILVRGSFEDNLRSQPDQQSIGPTPIAHPAALIPESPEIPIITDQQVAEWEALQDTFIQEIGNKLPTNDAERDEWLRAKQRNDEMFRLKFGTQAYLMQEKESFNAESSSP
ncbi:MAG: hypothetical protein KGR46_05690 [Verrucomicrobia bacterium]|nr:hypothetical protein [Verrucomicrobiota bacterium]